MSIEAEKSDYIEFRIKRRTASWLATLAAGLLSLVIYLLIREPVPVSAPDEIPTALPAISVLQGYNTPSRTMFSAYLFETEESNRFDKLRNFLSSEGVEDVVPPFELLRQGTDWLMVEEPPFAMPPESKWPSMVRTLQAIRDEVVPVVGPVHVLSGWRTPEYNRKAGGSRRSKHMHFCGVDLIPQNPTSRKKLVSRLRKMHGKAGRDWNMGLGIYSGIRFHIDTCGFRKW